MKGKRQSILRSLAITLVIFALLISGAISLLDYIGNKSEEAQVEMVREAVHNAVLTCYAVEGEYPSDIQYLIDNYGLSYDDSRFLITYEAFASNIFPDIRVNVKGAGDA